MPRDAVTKAVLEENWETDACEVVGQQSGRQGHKAMAEETLAALLLSNRQPIGLTSERSQDLPPRSWLRMVPCLPGDTETANSPA